MANVSGGYFNLTGDSKPSVESVWALSPRINAALARSPQASNATDGPSVHPGPVGGFYASTNGDCYTAQLVGLRAPVWDGVAISDDLGG